MSTTDHFQKNPDFVLSVRASGVEKSRDRVNTNPRYPHFNQTHFTAGDEEQFNFYRDNSNSVYKTIDNENNIFLTIENNIKWVKYRNLDGNSVDNTFNYIFNKFKKGIYVRIKDNKLCVFLPFSKVNYINEWSHLIKYDTSKYSDLLNFIESIQKDEQRPFFPHKVNKFVEHWYGNNCLVRWEFPISEGDSGATQMRDMLLELCKLKDLPDIEFFLNRRDFPILTKNETEAYDNIFGKGHKLVSHNYEKYCPILSMVSRENYADISIPTWEDWARVSSIEDGKLFYKGYRDYKYNFETNWNGKKDVAVFRGASTGVGTTVKTNQRLKAAYISNCEIPLYKDNKILDAGISKWNLRPRKVRNSNVLQRIEIDDRLLSSYLSPVEQSKFKYILNIPGHSAAYRLSLELSMMSVVLLVDCEYKLWFQQYLEPYVHYVPINNDLSDLVEKIIWCINNDKKCQQIAQNAFSFYEKYLSKNSILDFYQKTLIELKKNIGNYIYNYKSIRAFQIEEELNFQENNTTKSIKIKNIPQYRRSFYLFNSIKAIIRQNNCTNFENLFITKNSIVQKCNLFNDCKWTIVSKQLKNETKKKEFLHGNFVGEFVINRLLKLIPNFVFTFGINDNKKFEEFIKGESLDNYIKNKEFIFKDFLNIFVQILLALHVAQQAIGFIHYDLYPWNIVITKLEKETIVEYPISPFRVIKIKTKLLPVLIDYGKSHVIFNNRHYGLINLFRSSSCHDMICLLVSCVNTITTKQNVKINDIIKLMNFMKETKYTDYKTFRGISSIKKFTKHAKKFSEMLYSKKGRLENETPLSFFNFITTNFNIPYEESNKLSSKTSEDQTQIEEYFSIGNKSYGNALSRVKIDCNHNLVEMYKSIQDWTTIVENSIPFIKDKRRYNRIDSKFKIKIPQRIQEDLVPNNGYKTNIYSESTFNNLDQIIRVLDIFAADRENNCQSRDDIWELIVSTFLYHHETNKFNSNFPEELKFEYNVDNFRNLMTIAHKNTFLHIVDTVIRNDFEMEQAQGRNDRRYKTIFEKLENF